MTGLYFVLFFLLLAAASKDAPLTRFHVMVPRPDSLAIPIACTWTVIRSDAAWGPHGCRGQVELQGVDYAVCALAGELMHLPRYRTGLPRRSPRRKTVHRHTRLVAAALHAKLARLDADPQDTLRELGDMSLRICDAYLGHRWGRLLEDHELAGLEPARSYEALRLAAAGGITVGVSYVAALIGVPAAVLPLVCGLTGLLSFNLALGRTSRSLELLDSLRGIQRP